MKKRRPAVRFLAANPSNHLPSFLPFFILWTTSRGLSTSKAEDSLNGVRTPIVSCSPPAPPAWQFRLTPAQINTLFGGCVGLTNKRLNEACSLIPGRGKAQEVSAILPAREIQ